MTDPCPICGGVVPSTHPSRKYCCEDCKMEHKRRERRELYARTYRKTGRQAQFHQRASTVRPYLVSYPESAWPDRWTRKEFEMYGDQLPPEAKVEVIA